MYVRWDFLDSQGPPFLLQPVTTKAKTLRDNLRLINALTYFLSSDLNVTFLLLVSFAVTLSGQATALLQYTTRKYHWSYSKIKHTSLTVLLHIIQQHDNVLKQATILSSVNGVVELAGVLVILPSMSRLLLKRMGVNATIKDLWLSRATALCFTIGLLLMSLAPEPAILIIGLVVAALGTPVHLIARSLVTSLVLPDQVSVLYTAIAVVESVGILLAKPFLANTFQWGMKLGDTWLGLPFLAASVISLLAFLLICGVDLSRKRQPPSAQSVGNVAFSMNEDQNGIDGLRNV
ncbi:hypothetical protein TSTA_102410 [Talaromyces stipitatus ATCC 10500]|uniref:MFS transporter n=1 Tax=Talaromyces stipitatus (strain ATCC 10500 / CBS 375.48 / QM 6759 / NRRL 1006) TaxID=441959 RepID=B8MNC2_TALSN|nr:uncharacterized protein TSTA_102410 [Talaromyces stipitatus ATCC 10500]EED14011.1 hypothetical protein TSTA_102410 [Talaromyces stipitatus ATCC 10500]